MKTTSSKRSVGQKFASVAGQVTAMTPIKRAIGASIENHRIVWASIADMGRKAFTSPSKTPDIAPGVRDPAQRFKIARKVYGVDEATIEKTQSNTFIAFVFWMAMFVIMSAVGARYLSAFIAFQQSSFMGITLAFTGSWLTGCMVITSAFANWQLRTRRLGSFKEWISSPSNWFPLRVNSILTRCLGWVVVGSLALLHGTPAFAQTTSSTSINLDSSFRTDLPGSILNALAQSGGTPITHSLGIWASRLLVLAVGMLTWHLMIGLVNTAHEGKVLGQRWHQIWAPIRVLIGPCMLVPSPVTGLTGGMMLVLMLASIGSNFASDLWGQFATDTLIPKQQQADQTLQQANTGTATGGIGLGIPSPIGGLEIARQVLRSELCLATYQANPVLKSGILTRLNPYGGTPIPTAPAVAGMKNADGDKQVWDYQQCGSIDVPLIVQLATTNSASLTNGTSSASQTYVSAKITAVGAIIQGVRNSGLAQKMALSRQPGSPAGSVWPTGVVSSLVSVGSAYDSAMMTSAGAFIYSENTSSYTKIANDAKTIGWVSMGAYSRTLSQASSTVTELASQPPMFNGPLTPGTFTSSDPDLVINKMTANLKLLDDQWTAESAVPSLSGAELAGPGDANSDLIGRLINPISKPMTQALLGLGTTGATDPMRSIMNFGHVMMGIGEGAIATGAGVGFAFGNAISEKFGGPVVFQWVSAFVIPLICFVIFVGFTHAVIFPMMPYVSVLYLFCDWVLFVAEALIAVSLYFFFWFRMDGTELFGEHQKAGAIIMFNILLMPTLGVLGFEMVYYVLPIMIGFVNMTFGPAYVGIQGGHFVGLFIAFGGLAFQTYLLGQVTVRACSLIHEIVTRVPRWFGASADPHGASNDVSRTHNVVVGSVGSFNKTVGGAVQQNLGKTPPKTPGGNGGNDKPTPKV